MAGHPARQSGGAVAASGQLAHHAATRIERLGLGADRRYPRRCDGHHGQAAGRLSGAADDGALLEALTDSSLYSIGAYFCDRHPDLVDDVLAESEAIERAGLVRWAEDEGAGIESAFQTLITGLAVRYFKAVAGAS